MSVCRLTHSSRPSKEATFEFLRERLVTHKRLFFKLSAPAQSSAINPVAATGDTITVQSPSAVQGSSNSAQSPKRKRPEEDESAPEKAKTANDVLIEELENERISVKKRQRLVKEVEFEHQREVSQLKDEIRLLKKDRNELTASIDPLRRDLADCNSEKTTLQSQVSELQACNAQRTSLSHALIQLTKKNNPVLAVDVFTQEIRNETGFDKAFKIAWSESINGS